MWPDKRIQNLLGIEHPIIQAPMAGPVFSDMVIAVSKAGALGSMPCATIDESRIRDELGIIKQASDRPFNVNFFCHTPPVFDAGREAGWREKLAPYYEEYGLDPKMDVPASNRTPFDAALCALVEEFRPKVVSFHFGLPEQSLLERVKATGAIIMSSATTVDEAIWLEDHGCDIVIAQGAEAGGHRGNFLTYNMASQMGTFALVPQVTDAIKVPVIAAGGVTDARGIVAALALGAAGVQIGTAYLYTPEARIAPLHHAALRRNRVTETALTNVFTGRPARGILNRIMQETGPLSDAAPAFPLAGGALAPLRAASEKAGSDGFMSLWAGQAASLGREMGAGDLTRTLAEEALALLGTHRDS